MRKKIGVLFLVGVMLLFVSSGIMAADPVLTQLAQTPFAEIKEPPIQIQTLSNGLKIYYLKDDELPIVRMSAFFKFGRVYEKKNERGITSLFMTLMRTGGTKTLSPDQVDDQLAFVGASVDPVDEKEFSLLNFRCLQKDFSSMAALFFDMIKNPLFGQDRLEVLKKNELSRIQRRNEKGMDIAFREYSQSLYGEDSPLAWLSTSETISSINQDVLRQFYQEHVSPNQMILAASAPYEFSEFLRIISPQIMGWKKQLPDFLWPTAVKKEWHPGYELVQKEGMQSAIVVGHFGEKRFNADKFKLVLADELLGGSTFGSRLGQKLRTEMGLVYSISSHFGFDSDYGPFYMATLTQSEATLRVVQEMREVLTRMVTEQNITEEELQHAKERIINRLIFALEQPFDIVLDSVKYDFFGYPKNYLSLYQKELEKVTLSDVKQVLNKYFFPDQLKVLIVGDKNKMAGIGDIKGLTERPLDWE